MILLLKNGALAIAQDERGNLPNEVLEKNRFDPQTKQKLTETIEKQQNRNYLCIRLGSLEGLSSVSEPKKK